MSLYKLRKFQRFLPVLWVALAILVCYLAYLYAPYYNPTQGYEEVGMTRDSDGNTTRFYKPVEE